MLEAGRTSYGAQKSRAKSERAGPSSYTERGLGVFRMPQPW
jgi:hypothetical protein